MLKENKSHSEISKEIGIHKSTIAQFKQIKTKNEKKINYLYKHFIEYCSTWYNLINDLPYLY